VLSRILGPAEYGLVGKITVFTGFIMMFADAGIGSEVVRSPYKNTYYKAMFNMCFYLGLILTALFLLSAYPLTLFYPEEGMKIFGPSIVLAFLFFLRTIGIVPSSILAKEHMFGTLGRIRFFSQLLSIVLMILLAYLDFSFWALIIPLIIVEIVNYFWYSKVINFPIKIYSHKYTLLAWKYNKKLLANIMGFNIVNYWSRNADNLLIGKFYSSADLGIYNRGYRFIVMVQGVIQGIFGTVLLPTLNKLKETGGNIKKEYTFILSVISILSFPVGFILIAFPSEFVYILWGDLWMDVAQLLPYFGSLILIQPMSSTLQHMYLLHKAEGLLFKIGLISSIVTIAFIVVGIQYSYLDVARFYALSFIGFVMPINLIYGFSKTFGYSVFDIIMFWFPKLFLVVAIIVVDWIQTLGDSTSLNFMHESGYWNYNNLKLVLVVLYGLHLILFSRKELGKVRGLIMSKIKKG